MCTSLGIHAPQLVKYIFMKGVHLDLSTLLQASTTVSKTEEHKFFLSKMVNCHYLKQNHFHREAMLVMISIHITGHIDQDPHLLKSINTIEKGHHAIPTAKVGLIMTNN